MEAPILIINTTGFAPVMAYILEGEGFATEIVHDLETATARLAGNDYRATVLLADEEGSTAACEVLRRTGNTPIIVISPGMSTESCVQAIAAGADFCLRRTFGPLELAARVRALGHRHGQRPQPAVSPLI